MQPEVVPIEGHWGIGCMLVAMPSAFSLRAPLVDPSLLEPCIAPARTALLVIDVQEDFVGPDGAAAGWGADLGLLATPLNNIEALIERVRKNGATTVFARVVTRPETDTAALKTLHMLKGNPLEAIAICRAGTPGSQYHRVRPRAGDIEIEKALYSCFQGTSLDQQLRARGIDTLVLAGFTTDCCVDCTARDAFHRDYNVFVAADACGSYEPELHIGALNGLAANCAAITETQAILAAWR